MLNGITRIHISISTLILDIRSNDDVRLECRFLGIENGYKLLGSVGSGLDILISQHNWHRGEIFIIQKLQFLLSKSKL